MISETRKKPSLFFWIVAFSSLIWNMLGVGAYLTLATATQEDLILAYGPVQGQIAANHSPWYTAVFALAVFGGVLGSVCLIFRRKFALWPFAVSFGGTLIQLLYLIGVGAMLGFTTLDWIMPLLIPLIALYLVGFTLKKTATHVLR